jgi:hypothetical protein
VKEQRKKDLYSLRIKALFVVAKLYFHYAKDNFAVVSRQKNSHSSRIIIIIISREH